MRSNPVNSYRKKLKKLADLCKIKVDIFLKIKYSIR